MEDEDECINDGKDGERKMKRERIEQEGKKKMRLRGSSTGAAWSQDGLAPDDLCVTIRYYTPPH